MCKKSIDFCRIFFIAALDNDIKLLLYYDIKLLLYYNYFNIYYFLIYSSK